MTAVASPPSYQPQHPGLGWSSNGSSTLNSIQDEVSAMFMPRKSAQRSNSTSSISSNSSTSSTGTAVNDSMNGNGPNTSGALTPITDPGGNQGGPGAFGNQAQGNTMHKKKPARPRESNGPWPIGKAEASAGVTAVRPQSILATNGVTAASSMSSMQQQQQQQQQHSVLLSQGQPQIPTQQQNGVRGGAVPTEASPALYLLSQNGTFERKTISVPYYPDNLKIGRQTNQKTTPTPTNGYFDSKVLSRQHAEIWADRSGKIWIRDVRSSNGTFVNGSRLSAENKDSEPHELQTGDHLELGIDIVSEDQKSVVHHKVAAKVELAGFLGQGGVIGNVLDMGFGDLDPSNPQSGLMRGRPNPQGSMSSQQQRPGQQMQMGMAGPGQQMPRNFWLTPITTEAIVKRLTHEMRQARLQSTDLAQTEDFLSTILNNKDFAPVEKPLDPSDSQNYQNSQSKAFSPMANGQPTKMDPILISRFSDPPAPPPQQPLPEKPDGPRLNTGESALKRSNTARPGSQSGSPLKTSPQNSGQIVSLLEDLKAVKKENEVQANRMRELEQQLEQEKQARLLAEDMAKKFEEESSLANGVAVEPTDAEEMELSVESDMDETTAADDAKLTDEVESNAKKLQEKLEIMMNEMKEMKLLMETYRQRAENAEQERDDTRKSLAEMVQKIRNDETARAAKKSAKAERKSSEELEKNALLEAEKEKAAESVYGSAAEEEKVTPVKKVANGAAVVASSLATKTQDNLGMALQRSSDSAQLLSANNTAPYASMVGVVLLGLGIMTYLNGGWQKIERG